MVFPGYSPSSILFIADERLSVKAHITSLASGTNLDDVKDHFKTACAVLCDEDIELSGVLLGKGKAELTLKGILSSGEVANIFTCCRVSTVSLLTFL